MEYLTAAGYTYDAEAGVFTAAPEGGKMEFTALIPPYLAGENAMTIALSNLKSTLESLGFVMNIQEVTDLNEFVWYLSEHSADLWCGRAQRLRWSRSWSATIIPPGTATSTD